MCLSWTGIRHLWSRAPRNDPSHPLTRSDRFLKKPDFKQEKIGKPARIIGHFSLKNMFTNIFNPASWFTFAPPALGGWSAKALFIFFVGFFALGIALRFLSR